MLNMQRFLSYVIFIFCLFLSSAHAQQVDSFADDHFGSGNTYSNNNSDIYNPLAGNFLDNHGSSNYSGTQQGSQQWGNSFSTPNNPSSLGGEMYGPLEVP